MKAPPDFHQNRRWYDQIEPMSLAVDISQYLPGDIQSGIARNLSEHIDRCRVNVRTGKQAASVGRNLVLGLFQASNRQRWYDQKPDLSRAYNLMSSVPAPLLEAFGGRVLELESTLVALGYIQPVARAIPLRSLPGNNPEGAEDRPGTLKMLEQGEGMRLVQKESSKPSPA